MRMDKSMEITLIYTHMFLYTHSQTCKHVQYRYSNSHIKLYVIQVKEHCRPSCRENLSVFTCNCLKSMFSSLVFCDENTVLKWVVFVKINVGWLAHSILLCIHELTQPSITCSKLAIETLEQGVKYVQS